MGPPGPLSAPGDLTGNGPAQASPERRVALEAAANFRDLGGYRSWDGRAVRWRRVFRADDLSLLTPSDRATIRALGIATVIDLRSPPEVEAQRFPVEDIPVGFHHLPLNARLPDFEEFAEGPAFYARHYLDLARRSGAQIAQAVTVVADDDTHPVVVHCAAGKDRTGTIVGLALKIVGVTDELVIADYAASAERVPQILERLKSKPAYADNMRGKTVKQQSPSSDTMRLLLDALEARFGGVHGWLETQGWTREDTERMEHKLLD